MTSERIKEIQATTGYPDSVSIKQALLQVWNECEQSHPTTPSVKADGWVEQARNSFGLIVKWCEDSGLKQCDIGNKKHMAIYHSLHAAKNALNDFPVSIPAPPKQ